MKIDMKRALMSTPAMPPTTATKSTPGAGVGGAARGSIVGEIAGGNAGAGTAAGGVAVRGQSCGQNAAQAQQQQQITAQQRQAGMSAINGRAPPVSKGAAISSNSDGAV